MGLFEKLKNLVFEEVEGEETAKPKAQAPEGDDVVSAIEQIRMEIEQSSKTGFTAEFDEQASAPTPQPAGTPAPQPLPKGGLAAPAYEQVKVPKVLSIKEIYDQAKIPTGGGFDIYKVEEMLADPEIADLGVEMRARMVRLTLKNMGHELKDILADASIRDRALEDYSEFLNQQVTDVEQQVSSVNGRIQEEIDEFIKRHQAVIDGNNEKLRKVREAYTEYQRTKEVEEQRLFKASAPFVDQGQNPVDIGEKV